MRLPRRPSMPQMTRFPGVAGLRTSAVTAPPHRLTKGTEKADASAATTARGHGPTRSVQRALLLRIEEWLVRYASLR